MYEERSRCFNLEVAKINANLAHVDAEIEGGRLEGRAEGRVEGRLEGIEEGIKALILDNLESGNDKEVIKTKLMKRFALSEEESLKYLEKFSKC